MNGTDVKRQVMEARKEEMRVRSRTIPELHEEFGDDWPLRQAEAVFGVDEALAAFAPCVVLTREEAKRIAAHIQWASGSHEYAPSPLIELHASLALLTPADEGEAGDE